MQLPSPNDGWKRFLWRCIPLMAVLLFPWPGLGTWFSDAMAGLCDSLAGLVSGAGSEIHFVAERYSPEHPWWIQMSVKNVFTSESFQLPVDTRTVAYIRIVVFLSLAFAWPFWATRRVMKASAWGFAVLIGLIGLTLLIPLLQVLGMVRVLDLGTLAQSALSIGILTLVTYPSMAFAVPGLLWLLTLRVGDEHVRKSAGGAVRRAQASGTR